MKGNTKEVELKNYFAQQGDIEFAIIFGSIASGRASAISDIDIGVYFTGIKDRLEMGDRQIDITCKIMRLYKINRVDVAILNLANPFLRFQVLKYGNLIYAKDAKVFCSFKAASLGRYQDIKPMYDLYDAVAENSLRKGYG